MNAPITIALKKVSKRYYLHSTKPTLIEQINPFKKPPEFWALTDINLTLHRGDRLGIIGANGAGKTTLLKLIAGIAQPTKGRVTTHGKVVSLIELTAGFHPDLTGIDNIFVNGMLLGMTSKEVNRQLKQIIAFADIGHFINEPFYTYSSGMALRLGFAIAAHANPDIILLDENIAVGDASFTQKIYDTINNFAKRSATIIFASHVLELVAYFCPHSLWLDDGRVKSLGRTQDLIKRYQATL